MKAHKWNVSHEEEVGVDKKRPNGILMLQEEVVGPAALVSFITTGL